MTLQPGWLKRQMDQVSADVEKWPDWMKREAIFSDTSSEDAPRSGENTPGDFAAGGEED